MYYKVSDPRKYTCNYLSHVTDIPTAKRILQSQLIFGRDNGANANFSAMGYRADLSSKPVEVELVFDFTGAHYWTRDITLVGGNRPDDSQLNGLCNGEDVVFHIFSAFDECLYPDFPSHGYWQSNLYPGSSGLKLVRLSFLKPIEVIDISSFNRSTGITFASTQRFEAMNRLFIERNELEILAREKYLCDFEVPSLDRIKKISSRMNFILRGTS